RCLRNQPDREWPGPALPPTAPTPAPPAVPRAGPLTDAAPSGRTRIGPLRWTSQASQRLVEQAVGCYRWSDLRHPPYTSPDDIAIAHGSPVRRTAPRAVEFARSWLSALSTE